MHHPQKKWPMLFKFDEIIAQIAQILWSLVSFITKSFARFQVFQCDDYQVLTMNFQQNLSFLTQYKLNALKLNASENQ